MATVNILLRQLSLSKANHRPNIIIYLITRMGLGLFASVLPLLFLRFILSFFTSPISRVWQLHWAERLSVLFVMSMLVSVTVAVVIWFVTYNHRILNQYGRLVGRICTIAVTGLSFSIPYYTFLMTKGDFLLPTVLVACIAPVLSFIVVGSATKDYLLRMRIWFDRRYVEEW